jgi:hypothetical protein
MGARINSDYHFLDRWRVKGSVEEVAEILSNAPDLARWWPSTYLDVRVLSRGDERGRGEIGAVHAKGWLPYTIRFKYRLTDERYPYGFSLDAWGDLTGRGEWRFEQDGPWVNVTYEWRVRADKPLLRYSTFALSPLFRSNHNWTMKKGEESLRLEPARRRARTPAELATIPAPPGPFPAWPFLLAVPLLGLLAFVAWRWWRPSPILKVEHHQVIDRPAKQVFAYVSRVENDVHWQPEIETVHLTSAGPLRPGSTFREVRRTLGRKFVWDMRVTALEPDRRICIESIDGTLPYRGCRFFEPVEGGTRITEVSEVQLPRWLRPFNGWIARLSRRPVVDAYARLKLLLEGSDLASET